MILHGYICSGCRNVDEAFSDEPVPSCCGGPMKKRLAKGGASGSVFQLFRPYHNGQSMITSKAEENHMLQGMARTHVGGKASDLEWNLLTLTIEKLRLKNSDIKWLNNTQPDHQKSQSVFKTAP